MNTKRILCAALGAVCYFAFLQAQVRTEQTFEKGWKFTREDNAEFANPGYNDSKWQNGIGRASLNSISSLTDNGRKDFIYLIR